MLERSHFKWFFFFFGANYTTVLDNIYLRVKRANCFALLFYVNSVSLNNDRCKCATCWYPECWSRMRGPLSQPHSSQPTSRTVLVFVLRCIVLWASLFLDRQKNPCCYIMISLFLSLKTGMEHQMKQWN